MQDTTKSGGKAGNLIPGATGDWEVVIGMEVHAQVASPRSCSPARPPSSAPSPTATSRLSTRRCPACCPSSTRNASPRPFAPGSASGQINLNSVFDRKNYFYPDLPQGYQISQYKQPIVGEGEIEIDVDGEAKRVRIERLHLEQDAGKSIHDQSPEYSYVDLNRSGVALMEIVSSPTCARQRRRRPT